MTPEYELQKHALWIADYIRGCCPGASEAEVRFVISSAGQALEVTVRVEPAPRGTAFPAPASDS